MVELVEIGQNQLICFIADQSVGQPASHCFLSQGTVQQLHGSEDPRVVNNHTIGHAWYNVIGWSSYHDHLISLDDIRPPNSMKWFFPSVAIFWLFYISLSWIFHMAAFILVYLPKFVRFQRQLQKPKQNTHPFHSTVTSPRLNLTVSNFDSDNFV